MIEADRFALRMPLAPPSLACGGGVGRGQTFAVSLLTPSRLTRVAREATSPPSGRGSRRKRTSSRWSRTGEVP